MNRNAFRVPTTQPGSRMPQYSPQQLPAAPGADVSARLSDSAGQIIAQGADQQARQLEMLGRGMQQAAKAGYDLYHDYQATKAKEAWLTYKQEATTKRAELGRMQGKDAIDPEKGITAQMAAWRAERRQALMKDLGGPAASMFDTAAKDIDSSMDAWAIDKVNTERLNYENKTSEAHISLLQDEAMTLAANPALFGQKMGALEGELKAIAGRSGLDETWVKAKFQDIQQKTLTQTISDSIAGEQLGKANAMIKAYAPMLGGAAEGLRARAAAKGRELQARARAEAEKVKSRTALEAARSLMETYGGDTQQALAAIAEQTNNVEDRLRVTQSYMTMRNIDDAAQAQVRQEKTIADQNNILAQIKAAGSDPTALNAIIADAAPEHKQFALAHAEQALGKQPPAFSEPQAWAEANTAILNGERYEIVAGRYAGRLAKADMQELKTLAGKEDKQNEKEWKLYFDRIWSTSSHARITDTADRNQNKNQLEYEVARRLRGVTDPQKARDIIFDLVHDRQVPGFFGWTFGGSTITSIESRAYDSQQDIKIAVPDEARKLIEKQAEEEGRKLTEDDIVSTFLRNRNKFGW